MNSRPYRFPDIEDHRWQHWPDPVNFLMNDLDLELGCGNGRHSLQYCRSHPDRNLVAIERTRLKFDKFLTKAKKIKPENLLAVHADGTHWVAKNLGPETIQRCFILYPNPYPKAKQANLRWHNMPFFLNLLDKIKIGGTIHYCSNLKWYIEEAELKFLKLKGWRTLPIQEIKYDPKDYRTDFEEKYQARGELCYQLTLTKSK